jgi:hypothetical protein
MITWAIQREKAEIQGERFSPRIYLWAISSILGIDRGLPIKKMVYQILSTGLFPLSKQKGVVIGGNFGLPLPPGGQSA